MTTRSIASAVSAAVLLVLLAGCATPPAPDARGRWKPVNRYSETPLAIPLTPAYVYFAAPLDRTLKGLLERWARDGNMKLDYRHDADFTLHRPVADVRSDDLRDAVARLGALYAPQQVAIEVEGDRIVVRRASAQPAASTP